MSRFRLAVQMSLFSSFIVAHAVDTNSIADTSFSRSSWFKIPKPSPNAYLVKVLNAFSHFHLLMYLL